ncbi:MAG TPA: DUF4233 domain-containing protein [Humibacter sp.]|nr:DUF4233 domain-containing protein [Humibacter sp.]
MSAERGSAGEPERVRRLRRIRSVQESLGSIVLGFEFVVVFLGALVIFGLKAVAAPLALGGGAVLVVAMLATIPLLRYRWGFWIGWLLQLIVLASGFLVGMMFVVGAIFTALWTYCMITGARLDRAGARAAASEPAPGPDTEETENQS